ncbi:hypothetical protein Bbelb_336140 [Branchiostoma belcheri]|nr:hypothetical protein Bbelb_336140 [Branchiostoma belcheri]
MDTPLASGYCLATRRKHVGRLENDTWSCAKLSLEGDEGLAESVESKQQAAVYRQSRTLQRSAIDAQATASLKSEQSANEFQKIDAILPRRGTGPGLCRTVPEPWPAAGVTRLQITGRGVTDVMVNGSGPTVLPEFGLPGPSTIQRPAHHLAVVHGT